MNNLVETMMLEDVSKLVARLMVGVKGGRGHKSEIWRL